MPGTSTAQGPDEPEGSSLCVSGFIGEGLVADAARPLVDVEEAAHAVARTVEVVQARLPQSRAGKGIQQLPLNVRVRHNNGSWHLPVYCKPMVRSCVLGLSGRSIQTASIRFSCTATSEWPALVSALDMFFHWSEAERHKSLSRHERGKLTREGTMYACMGSEKNLQFFIVWRSCLSSSPVIFGDMGDAARRKVNLCELTNGVAVGFTDELSHWLHALHAIVVYK
ncbi:hypothetical protein EYF80_032257 [Liparis tanakae]|uniref:Uncharacterized protein n=1 Tax=Liparis tanakae TaxID=230148 RepID=A0A4Z2GXN6_9TELE|nr:hypothetical protein EYF80_032257 [Liparis tanakae]